MSLLEAGELVIKQRAQLMAKRIEFAVLDQHGGELGSVVQVGRDAWDRTLHPRADGETLELAESLGVDAGHAHLLTPFEMRSSTGEVVLRLVTIKALKTSMVVCAPDGAERGRILLENIVGKSRFGLAAAGTNVGSLKALTWRRKTFAVNNGDGVEVARIEMTAGTSGDRTDANDYAVHILEPLDDPMRSLAVASTIAVDLILWQRHSS
jgi:hypothetical protein